MKNPYDILTVSFSATDAEIKDAYIQKVKEFPPERFPEEFKEIRDAYMKIATLKDRVHYKLFSLEKLDLKNLMEGFIKESGRNRISPEILIDFIKQLQYNKTI